MKPSPGTVRVCFVAAVAIAVMGQEVPQDKSARPASSTESPLSRQEEKTKDGSPAPIANSSQPPLARQEGSIIKVFPFGTIDGPPVSISK
jgi:hypothetical protein